jgi:hypothetical protein
MPEVPPELIVHYLTNSEIGAVYWERAKYKALAEVLSQRVDELERQGQKTDG